MTKIIQPEKFPERIPADLGSSAMARALGKHSA